jgi:Rrf2 family protein
MLTHTSELAIKALMYLAGATREGPTSPRAIAADVGCSPTYLVKTLRLLARAGILRSRKGARGGVSLAREPEHITLLHIIEACQGLLVANYCQALAPESAGLCAFHLAMQEVHDTTKATLSRWTLADMTRRPAPANSQTCRMALAVTAKGLTRKAAHA